MATNKVPGYVHPEKATSSSRGRVYKTFNDQEKPRKNEVFGNTVVLGKYASANDQEKDGTSCPVCNEVFVKECNCVYSEKTCAQGHIWYFDRDGTVVKGNPHK
jgi:hypothetical protein